MEGILIREVCADDFPVLYEFINALEEVCFDQSRQEKIFLKNLEKDHILYRVAIHSGEIVGFISCHIQDLLHHGGAIAEIMELYVPDHYRNNGIGSQLISFIKPLLKARGVLQLEVTTNQRREDAHRFYEREQFVYTSKKFVQPLLQG